MIDGCETDQYRGSDQTRELVNGHPSDRHVMDAPDHALLQRVAELEAENRRLKRAVSQLAHRVLTDQQP